MGHWLWGGAIAIVVGACALPTSGAADGEECSDSDDCASGHCAFGVCERDCAESASSCRDGWSCKSQESSNVILGGTNRTARCVPLCAACPSTMYCRPSLPPDAECMRKPPAPQYELAPPDGEITLGTPVTLRLTLISERTPAVEFRWVLGEDGEATTTVPEITHTFTRGPRIRVHVTVKDSAGVESSTSAELLSRR